MTISADDIFLLVSGYEATKKVRFSWHYSKTCGFEPIFMILSSLCVLNELFAQELIVRSQRAVNLHLQYTMPPPDHVHSSANGRQCAVGFGVAHNASAIHISASALSFFSSNGDAAMTAWMSTAGREETARAERIDEDVRYKFL